MLKVHASSVAPRLIYLLIFGLPILFAFSTAPRPLGFAIYGGAGFALLAMALWAAAAHPDVSAIQRTLTRGPNPAILTFVVSAAVSAAISVNRFYSQLALIQLLAGVLVYATVVYRFQRADQMRTLLSCLVALGILVVAAALALDPRLRDLQLAGAFHDRQLLGGFLCLLLPLLCGLASGLRHRIWKITAQISAILVTTGLLLTGCRSSWVGAGVGLLVFGALALKYAWKERQWAAHKHLLFGTPLIAAAAIAILIWNTGLAGNLKSRASTFGIVQKDASVVDRFHLWSVAGQAFAARPGAGWGIGAYPFAQAQLDPKSRSVPEIVRTGPSLSENPHNTYLLIAAEQGLPGLLAYLSLLAGFMLTAYRSLGRTTPGMRQFVLIGTLAAIAGQSVDAFSNPGAMFPEVSLFFWLILAIGMRAAGLGWAASPSPATDASRRAPASPLRLIAAGAALCALAAHLVGVNLLAAAAAANPAVVAGVGPPGQPNYGGPPPPGGGSGSREGGPGLLAGVSTAGAAAITGAVATKGCVERYPQLPPGEDRILSARVVANRDWFGRGTRRCVFFEVLSERDNQWYSVTHYPGATLEVRSGQEWVAPANGLSNRFHMSEGVPNEWDGRHVVLRGELVLPNGKPISAELALPVRLKDEDEDKDKTSSETAHDRVSLSHGTTTQPAACCD